MNKRTLLIVDDNIMTRQHILSVAQNMEFDVEEAENAAEAIELIKKGIAINVVIGDIRTSGASGMEFLKSLKAASPPPVIMLATIDGSVVISKEFVTGGAFEYLTKSIETASIEKTVDTAAYQKQLSEKPQEELAKAPKVLVLENDASCKNIIENAIKEIGYDIVAAPDGTKALSLINQGGFEMIIVNVNSRFLDKDDIIPLMNMKASGSDVIVIFVTDSPDIDMAVQAIKRGAYDLIPKPLDAERLKTSIRTAWEKKRHDLQDRLLLLLYEEIKKNAINDTLTGLRNSNYATMRLEEEIKRVKREDYDTFAVVIGDIDNFRMINDKAGRHIGDVVLQQIGTIIKETVRKTDIASRTDGDEFMMILPGTDCYGAEMMVKKVIKKILEINRQEHASLKDLPVDISMSFGISCIDCAGPEFVELLAKADYALYECKMLRDEKCLTYERLLREKPHKEGLFEITDEFEKEISNKIAYSLASLIDHKDMRTRNHSKLVSALSVRLGKYLCLPDEILYKIQMGGMLHDIGKLGVSLEILGKRDKLTAEEIETLKRHVEIGVKIVSSIHNLEMVAPVIASIYERWDGAGYPNGLKGEKIPVESRVISVVNTYLAMRIDRAYRKGVSDSTAIEELLKNRGKQFDPQIIDAFLQIQRQR